MKWTLQFQQLVDAHLLNDPDHKNNALRTLLQGDVMNIKFNEGIHTFLQQIVQIPAAPISPQSRQETKSPTQTKTHNSSLANP